MRTTFMLLALLSLILQGITLSAVFINAASPIIRYFASTATIVSVLTHCLTFFDVLARLSILKNRWMQETGRYEAFKQMRRQVFKLVMLGVFAVVMAMLFLRPDSGTKALYLAVFASMGIVSLVTNGIAYYKENTLMRICEI